MITKGFSGISGLVNFVAGATKRNAGFMLSLDTIPPLFLPFTFPPASIIDDVSPEYSSIRQPAGRYSFPVYKGMGQRTISFTVSFDSGFMSPGATEPTNSGVNECDFGNSLNVAYPISVVIAHLEKFKTPKNNFAGIGKAWTGLTNGILKMVPDTAEPTPPVILLSTGAASFAVGYLSQAKVNKIRFTPYMMATRIEVQIVFLVTPDMVFTTLEEVGRDVLSILDPLISIGRK